MKSKPIFITSDLIPALLDGRKKNLYALSGHIPTWRESELDGIY